MTITCRLKRNVVSKNGNHVANVRYRQIKFDVVRKAQIFVGVVYRKYRYIIISNIVQLLDFTIYDYIIYDQKSKNFFCFHEFNNVRPKVIYHMIVVSPGHNHLLIFDSIKAVCCSHTDGLVAASVDHKGIAEDQ